MRVQWPAMASSTELSTTSQTRWWRPLGPVEPMYMPGPLADGLEALEDGDVLGPVGRPVLAPRARPFTDGADGHRARPHERSRSQWRFEAADESAGQTARIAMTTVYQRGDQTVQGHRAADHAPRSRSTTPAPDDRRRGAPARSASQVAQLGGPAGLVDADDEGAVAQRDGPGVGGHRRRRRRRPSRRRTRRPASADASGAARAPRRDAGRATSADRRAGGLRRPSPASPARRRPPARSSTRPSPRRRDPHHELGRGARREARRRW